MIDDVICPRCESDHVRRSLKTASERLFFSSSNYYRCRACSLRFRKKSASTNKLLQLNENLLGDVVKSTKKQWDNLIRK